MSMAESNKVILRDVAGHDWGWFTRGWAQDFGTKFYTSKRMHLQTMEKDACKSPDKVKVWLENKGQRIFELTEGELSDTDFDKLKAAVFKNRERIEDAWITFMLENNWLEIKLSGSEIFLTAYPNSHNKFIRIVTWNDVRADNGDCRYRYPSKILFKD